MSCVPATVERRAQRDAECRGHRQPVGQGHGKGGLRGYDDGKKVNGRKRHIAVDTGGRLVAIVVRAACDPDGEAGIHVARQAQRKAPTIRKSWVDAAYRGHFVVVVRSELGWDVEVVGAPKAPGEFVVQPRRWVVERTFAWLGKYRRLSKDYEERVETSQTWICLAMAHILLRRIASH
jgi:putative transposase